MQILHCKITWVSTYLLILSGAIVSQCSIGGSANKRSTSLNVEFEFSYPELQLHLVAIDAYKEGYKFFAMFLTAKQLLLDKIWHIRPLLSDLNFPQILNQQLIHSLWSFKE